MVSDSNHGARTFAWAETALYLMSGAGVAASAFVIFSFALFPTLRRRAFRLVLFLAISDCGASLTIFLNFHTKSLDDRVCTLQAFTQQFFTVGCILWPLVIALNLFSAVVLRGGKGSSGNEKLSCAGKCVIECVGSDVVTHIVVWGGALVSAIIPVISDSYGQAGDWCWIPDTNNESSTLRIADFYLLVWTSFVFSSVAYCMVHRTLRRLLALEEQGPAAATSSSAAAAARTRHASFSRVGAGDSPDQLVADASKTQPVATTLSVEASVMKRVMRTLMFYPLVFGVAWLPNTFFRLAEIGNYSEALTRNKTVASLFVALYAPAVQAVLDALVYGSTPAVRNHWASFLLVNSRRQPSTDSASTTGVGNNNNNSSSSNNTSKRPSRFIRRSDQSALSQNSSVDSSPLLSSSVESWEGNTTTSGGFTPTVVRGGGGEWDPPSSSSMDKRAFFPSSSLGDNSRTSSTNNASSVFAYFFGKESATPVAQPPPVASLPTPGSAHQNTGDDVFGDLSQYRASVANRESSKDSYLDLSDQEEEEGGANSTDEVGTSLSTNFLSRS